MSKSKKSFLGGLFNKQQDADQYGMTTDDIRQALIGLSEATTGLDTRIDAEIDKLKKMLQIGSPVREIQQHISAINIAFQQYLKHINDQESDCFKRLQATAFIDELLATPLDQQAQQKLTNYRGALSTDTLATSVLPDIFELLGPDIDELQPAEQAEPLTVDNIKAIAEPVVALLNSIELEQGQHQRTRELLLQAQGVTSREDLCHLLDDVSDLIISSIISVTHQFENFLQDLKNRLDQVDDFIEHQDQTTQALSDCSDILTTSMNKQVDDLQVFITNSQTMEELGSHINAAIEHILHSLNGFNSKRLQIEQDSQAQIKALQEQLAQAHSEADNLRENLQQQRKRALTDPLTKLPNRHAYNERLHLEYNRWRRYKKPLSLVVTDVDHFKQVNDKYGHAVGDQVLSACAQQLSDGIRETDFIGRYGGEEFVLLLPETNVKDAIRAMNKLRVQIEAHSHQSDQGSFQITMSFGVANFEPDDDFNLVFTRADTALYRAKSRGRNQVCAELKKND